MKNKKNTIIVFLVLIVFNVSISFGENELTNRENFKSAYSSKISIVGVAISTNIGIRGQFEINKKINDTIFNEVISIDGFLSIRNSRKDKLVEKNVSNIKEYLNLLKTDVKKILNTSNNIKRTLETFISGLELKYKNSVINKINLEKQKFILQGGLIIIDNKIQTLKIKISGDFKRFNSKETNKNIKQYLKFREQYTIIRTYLIFVNKFIAQYDFLNSYNKTLLDTLINNKGIIIKKSFIVIPDTGSDLLKELDLIISEEEFKRNESEKK